MSDYTYKWNHDFIQNTKKFNLKNLDLCLEIGCFEGLTSNFICDTILNASGLLVCLDPLTDNYLNDNLTQDDMDKNQTDYAYFNNQYDRFSKNTQHQKDKIKLIRQISSLAFPTLLSEYARKFDLIYIDGDHRASAVYIDGVNSYLLTKPSGILIFDDYGWGKNYDNEATSYGIDKFIDEYSSHITVLGRESQVVIRKND